MLPPEDQVNCVRTIPNSDGSFPPAPPGSYWKDIGEWNVSGYVYALESDYSGGLFETEVGAKITAKWDFLFKRDGVVMQGTGILQSRQVIHYDGGAYWVDKANNRVAWNPDRGRYEINGNGAPSDIEKVGNPEGVRFQFGYGGPGYRMTEYYHMAAPPEIPKGTKLYIPALKPYTPYGGIFKVVDRGGAITNHRLDLFVGEGKKPGYDWNYGKSDIRHNVRVYELKWGSKCDQP
jgi:3D (Asp-Asp-Asp) domain-containing protein